MLLITLETARKTIKEYPTEDSYISQNIQRFMNWETVNGELAEYPDDNSIQLADFWNECYRLVKFNK